MSLAALLGLAGGAQGLSGGLQGMSQRFEARDEERKRTALQLLMAGWQPTPTAQGHPNATGLAHSNGAVDVLNDLKAPTPPVTRTGGDGYRVSQDTSSSTPVQPDVFAQPETIDVPGMGSYSQTPQAALRSLLAIEGPMATIRHENAETRALESKPDMPLTVPAGTGVLNRNTGKYDVPVPVREPEHAPILVADPKNPSGPGIYVDPRTAVGQHEPTKASSAGGLSAAPLVARASQFGGALSSFAKVIPLHNKLATGGIPLGAPTASAIASGHSFIANEIPGAAELAGRAENQVAPDYASYDAEMANALLYAAHSIGGARINQDQLKQLQHGLMLRGDETPELQKQKLSAFVDFLNAAAASLPPDLRAQQEATMDPRTLALLRQYGYGGNATGTAYSMLRDAGVELTDALQSAPATAPAAVQPGITPHRRPTIEELLRNQ